MKNLFLLTLICMISFMLSCSKQTLYDLPTVDGKFIVYDISSSTTNGVSTLDPDFNVSVTFATAKQGDVMNVVVLKQQSPPQGGASLQWLPIDGTQRTITLGSDLKTSVTYTRAEAQLNKEGDVVKVVFSGETDYNITQITMVSATTVSNPKSYGKEVVIARTPDVAFFNVDVKPKSGEYTGNLIVKKKNGKNEPWIDAGAGIFTIPALVPISGNDFAVDKDTMYYSFATSSGSFSDIITKTVVVLRNPYFYLKKSGTLTLGGSKAGVNLFTNSAVAATSANAIIAIDNGSILIHGGSAWAVGGKSIQFVQSNVAMFDNNSPNDVIAAFEAGSPTAAAHPADGSGVYMFRIVNGSNPEDVFYGIIKATNIIPGVSFEYEYRIGNMYAHLAVIR